MVAAAQAEGEAAFHRKVEYLARVRPDDRHPRRGRAGALPGHARRCSTRSGRTTSTTSTSCATRSSTGRGARRTRWSSTSRRPSRCSRTSCTTSSPPSPSAILKIQVTAEPPRQPAAAPIRHAPGAGPTSSSRRRARQHRADGRPASSSRDAAGRVRLGRRGGVPEVGRNDPCPCGCGKKYKKCHGAGA